MMSESWDYIYSGLLRFSERLAQFLRHISCVNTFMNYARSLLVYALPYGRNMDEIPQKHHLTQVENEQVEVKKPKFTPFADLSEDQLMSIFGEGPPFRFELCNVFLTYDKIPRDLKLFGTIQAAVDHFSPDPLLQNVSFNVFNREFSNPIHVSTGGFHHQYDLCYCSLPVSSTSVVQIAAKLYVTTDKVDDMEIFPEDYDNKPAARLIEVDDSVKLEHEALMAMFAEYENEYYENLEELGCNLEATCTLQTTGDKEYFNNEAFEVCDAHALINIPEKPNGGSGKNITTGKDGSIELCYVALKYAVDADLEIEFEPTSSGTKVSGRVRAYYGKGYDYDPPAYDYYVMLFKTEGPNFFKRGKLNLMRSALAVPAKFSLIIEAELYDYTTAGQILSGTYEFPVPRDGGSFTGSIKNKDCSLNLKVNWKLPFEKLKISPSSNSSGSRLTERRKIGTHSTSTMVDPDERNRWSLQEEIAKVFNTSLERTFNPRKAVSCSISTCTKEDGGDYLCSSVMHIWPEIKESHKYKGPKHAGVVLKDMIMGSDYRDMMERCVVCGPGFVKFKLCTKWIAKSIHKMLTDGIDSWAPKVSVKKSVVYFLSQNITEEMHMGHFRSTLIGEALARMLEYSGVVVLRKRIHDEDHLDIEGKSSYDLYISETLDLLRGKGLTIVSEGDGAVFIEGRKLPLVYLTTLRHALDVEKADSIVHVTDVGKRDYIEMCITAAKRVGLITDDHSKYPLSHVGFGHVQGDDFERFQTFNTKVVSLVNLLDEAKSRCKVLLAGQAGMADEWTTEDLEYAAEALGYGAVKYADLKNNRLTDYTFSFDQMLNEKENTAVYLHYTHHQVCSIIRSSSKDIKELTVEELILMSDDERELGLHFLRFTEVLGEACTILAPHILCEYVYELCEKFNGLHSSVWQVVGSNENTGKLLLCEASEVVMRKCFDLLGIAPICKI
ncbi:Aminoacyl-tRNA synthetase, class 1a, anticodon-binding [Artemisia annua]|uniref:arginine--tRNA ligase n=1 Tax=Artemisia annua TaxID=35608 RepID=A0A2U1PMC1_ARTAN|nr:Aminoacyl-tRNA synthetase, class 1a, anticodon-binding [Artemisia annua]